MGESPSSQSTVKLPAAAAITSSTSRCACLPRLADGGTEVIQ